jgi:hypothetical protein
MHAALHIEDAPSDVVVNKLAGDTDGASEGTFLDVMAHLWTNDHAVSSGIEATLTVPGDALKAPVESWVRSASGRALSPVAVADLGAGKYKVITELPYTCLPSGCRYGYQIVWRFHIPSEVSPQGLDLDLEVLVPGYRGNLVRLGSTRAALRLVRYPAAVVITNRALLYEQYLEPDVDRFLQALYSLVQGEPYNDQPVGVVYNVERYSSLAGSWDNAAVNYASEATANVVANEIDALIGDWMEDGGPVQYLMLVGGDEVIPFYRYDDPSDWEGRWDWNSASNPAIHATDEDYLFADAPFGDLGSGTDWQMGVLDVAVGRLLGESAADMLALLESSTATTGRTGRSVMASVDGWELGLPASCGSDEVADLLNVPQYLVAQGLDVRNDTEIPVTTDVMRPYPANWNEGFRAAANGGMDVFFIGGHNDPGKAYIPGDHFTPDDTCAALSCGYHRFDDDHPLAFVVGCHGGLPVPDVDVPGGADHNMVYDLVREGARAYVGASGYSYGSPNSLCQATWGERLLQHFFEEFVVTSGSSVSVGEALRRAKDRYVFGYGRIKPEYDRKTVAEYNLFGVPWQGLDVPPRLLATAPPPSMGTSAVTRRSGAVVRSDAYRYTRVMTVEVASYEATQVITGGTTYDLLSIPGASMAIAPGLPVLPYVEGYTLPMPVDASLLGVTLTSSTCSDAGSYEIPIIVAQPWTEGGTTYTTVTDIDSFFPPESARVQWQEQGDQLLFTVFPIYHNPTSNVTWFCSQMVFEVVYSAPLPLAVINLQPQPQAIASGDPVRVTALMHNLGDEQMEVTATLDIIDIYGNAVGSHVGGSVSISAGGHTELSLSWLGSLEAGSYALELRLLRAGQVVGLAACRLGVRSADTILYLPVVSR